MDDEPAKGLSAEAALGARNDDPPAEPARLDAFVSYRRRPGDVAFVDQLLAALAERGKQVWVDRQNIEPAADWSQRIARGIQAAKAFIFVITPESVASPECMRELDTAARHHKLIIPVVLRDVDRSRLPESLTRPNWIFFGPGHDAGQALDEVVQALETDLDWRDAHTRLAVRAKEWSDSQRDRSFLLHGSDLHSAEEWLSQAPLHQKTPPTTLQAEYVLASRKSATRAQRTWRAALSTGLVIALALAGLAFVQRNDARTEARLAQSHALAAEAISNLPENPGRGLRLALSAARIDPGGPAQQALRLALAQDRLRMAIRSGTGSGTVAQWNPGQAQIAVTAPDDSVALWSTATGRLTQTLTTGHQAAVTQLLYDPGGTRLAAVSSLGYVSMWAISPRGVASVIPTARLNAGIQATVFPSERHATGAVIGVSGTWAGQHADEFDVFGPGLSNVLIFNLSSGVPSALFAPPLQSGAQVVVPSPDGSELLVGGDIVDLRARRLIPLSNQAHLSPPGPACWFPDGSAVLTSTSVDAGGPVEMFRAKSGTLFAHMQTPVGPTTAAACSAGPADEWVAAGDASGNVVLRLASGALLPLSGHSDSVSAIASSPDGRFLATASADGTARIWDAGNGRTITVLSGDGAPLTGIGFGAGGALALTVDSNGMVRIWDTGTGEPETALRGPAQGQAVPLGFTAAGRRVYGAGFALSAGNKPAITAVTALLWNTGNGSLVRTIALPEITPSTVPCPRNLVLTGAFAMMSSTRCDLPPPSNLLLAFPVPRFMYGTHYAVVALFALAVSPDGRYVAYARSHDVTVMGLDGRQTARLPLASTPTGLFFGSAGDELVVMTSSAIYVWRPLSGRPAEVFRQASAPVDAALSASGNRLAAVSATGTIEIWNAAGGGPIRSLRPPHIHSSSYWTSQPLRAALSPDGNVIAAGDANGTVVLWNTATGKRIAIKSVSTWPIIELDPQGSRLLAVDWPQAGSGVNPAGAAAVLNWATGQVLASYQSPAPLDAPVDPGAALSPDGSFMFAGALGLAPAPPAGLEASYQVSGGAAMAAFPAAAESPTDAYSLFPAQPWSPDSSELLAGHALYPCDACGSIDELRATATSRIAWAQALSERSDHPPGTNPYR